MKHLIICMTVISNLANAQSADSNQNYIHWNKSYKLQISDFLGPVPNNSGDKAAGCAAEIKGEPYYIGNTLHYRVINSFDRNMSFWNFKPSSDSVLNEVLSKNLLEHEQIHFDIAEIYARLIRKSLKELNEISTDSISEINKIFESLMAEREVEDSRFDTETEGGLNITNQQMWRDHVDKMLGELKKYSN